MQKKGLHARAGVIHERLPLEFVDCSPRSANAPPGFSRARKATRHEAVGLSPGIPGPRRGRTLLVLLRLCCLSFATSRAKFLCTGCPDSSASVDPGASSRVVQGRALGLRCSISFFAALDCLYSGARSQGHYKFAKVRPCSRASMTVTCRHLCPRKHTSVDRTSSYVFLPPPPRFSARKRKNIQ